MEQPYRLARGPCASGDLVLALRRSGALAHMTRMGVRCAACYERGGVLHMTRMGARCAASVVGAHMTRVGGGAHGAQGGEAHMTRMAGRRT